MKFILWTLVWFGLQEMSTWRWFHYVGQEKFYEKYSDTVRFFAELVNFFLYIYLYIIFIK